MLLITLCLKMQELTAIILCSTFILYFGDHVTQAEHYNDRSIQGLRRPCPNPTPKCISQVLGEQLVCDRKVREPYGLDNLSLNIPNANASFVWKNSIVTGFRDYKINEFYIDASNTLVLEVEFKTLTVTSPRSYSYYFLKGRAPEVTSDYVVVFYKDLSLTLSVPYDSRYKVTDGLVFTYQNDATPIIHIGPGLRPKNIDALKANALVYKDLSVTTKEVFVTQGPVFMSLFLQIVVCEARLQNYTTPN